MKSKCRHFTGIQYERCAAGVDYDAVKTRLQPFGMALPCLNEPGHTCSLQSLYTPEELAEQDREAEQAIIEITAKIEGKLCLECGEKYTPVQTGRCVYGQECGHRQYQGKADPNMSDEEYEEMTFAWMDDAYAYAEPEKADEPQNAITSTSEG